MNSKLDKWRMKYLTCTEDWHSTEMLEQTIATEHHTLAVLDSGQVMKYLWA